MRYDGPVVTSFEVDSQAAWLTVGEALIGHVSYRVILLSSL